MPYKYYYMEPEIEYATKHNGEDIIIYKTYGMNDYELPFLFWFTLAPESCNETDDFDFDIR
ncbi:MAG: hypothetical protein ACRDB0_07000, partial [Paraclostridium sp.]